MIHLRDYQQQAFDAVLAAWAAGRRSPLLVHATGTGKTVTFAHLARHVINGTGKRVMVLAHRDELIRQAADKLRRIAGIAPEIEKAGEFSAEESLHGKPPIVVSSIQTQYSGSADVRRMHRFNPADFGLVVADEAHHSSSDSWRTVIGHYLSSPACRLLGVTATPDRNDDRNIGAVFDCVAHTYQLFDAIADGYLVPVRQRSVIVSGIDFSQVRTKRSPDGGRDFVDSELEAVMIAEKPCHQVAAAAIELAYGLDKGALRGLLDLPDDERRRAEVARMVAGRRHRRALVFCVSVKHAQLTADVLNRWLGAAGVLGNLANSVDGEMAMTPRRERMRAFTSGARPFLCNCMIATEGFDVPETEIIVCARPTKSRSLFAQMLGRGTRPWPDIAAALGRLPDAAARTAAIAASVKRFVEILDFTDNSGRHELVTAVDLIAPPDTDAAVIERAKSIADEESDVDAGAALAAAADQIELERALARMDAESAAQQMDAAESADFIAGWRRSLVGAGEYQVIEGRAAGGALAGAQRGTGGATDKQIGLLVKLGVHRATAMSYGKRQASAVIADLKQKRCTSGQSWKLKQLGWTEDEISGLNFDQAHEEINAAMAAQGAGEVAA